MARKTKTNFALCWWCWCCAFSSFSLPENVVVTVLLFATQKTDDDVVPFFYYATTTTARRTTTRITPTRRDDLIPKAATRRFHHPVTIKQIADATASSAEADEFALVTGKPIGLVTVVGKIVSKEETGTHKLISIDDGTGIACCKEFAAKTRTARSERGEDGNERVRASDGQVKVLERREIHSSDELQKNHGL